MVDARLLVWASVDRRDERTQLIVDDCRSIEDLQLLQVELDAVDDAWAALEAVDRCAERLGDAGLRAYALGTMGPLIR